MVLSLALREHKYFFQELKMKFSRFVLAALSVIFIIALIGCASGAKEETVRATVVKLEDKGTAMSIPTPTWISTYLSGGVSALQAQPEYRNRYCVIGEESGVNKDFVLAWADNFSAQQRIGAMLRTTIASEYQARVQGMAQSTGGSQTSGGSASGDFKQEIDSSINTIVNVSYSGAQRDADLWVLNRRYDPDVKESYSDEYTAYVLYTIPKAELERQVAQALETSVSADSELYQITIDMAREILQNGLARWGED